MIEIVNLTPHQIDFAGREPTYISPSGIVARVDTLRERLAAVG